MDGNQTEPLQGWTSPPDGRGTIDILTSSIITLGLCSWSVLSLNAYPPSFDFIQKTWRKCLMTVLCFLGPEFIFQLAAGQWCSARSSVKEFRSFNEEHRKRFEEKYPTKEYPERQPWTMTHAFFANMGGFVLQARLSYREDFPLFPLDAKQVLYLLEHNYIDYEDVAIDKELIKDKDKVDGVVRLIALCQILWYLVGCGARLVQRLPVTILELTTVGFIIESVGTYLFWWCKPYDISRPIVIRSKADLLTILSDAGDQARKPYRATPLDFVYRELWSWTLYWTYCKGLLRILFHIDVDERKRPIDAIPDDNFPLIVGWPMWVVFISQACYGAIHLLGWFVAFPSPTERLLWRIATVAVVGCIMITWAVEFTLWRSKISISSRVSQTESSKEVDLEKNVGNTWRLVRRVAARMRNTTFPRDEAMDVPLKVLIPVLPAGAIYCLGRAYIIAEGFINLRRLPPSAYETVNWSNFIPHVL